MSFVGALTAPHRRLTLFWLLAGLGLVSPWPMTEVDWRRWVGGVCTVASIHDGDTLRAVCGGERLQVRLHCIDAPELAQGPWGQASRDRLRALVPREVSLRVHDTDRFGRKVAEVMTLDGDSVNRRMIQDGQAAVYRTYCSDPSFIRLEAEARAKGLGIWERPGAQQTPWAYLHAAE